MISILEQAKEIVDLIKNTQEYKNYLKAKEALEKESDLKYKYLEYRSILAEIYVNGEEALNIEDKLYELYEVLMSNPITKEYMMYEEKLLSFYNEMKKELITEIDFLI